VKRSFIASDFNVAQSARKK